MVLSIAEITVELREILLKDRPQALYDISKKGTVPVLQTEEQIIDESMDIIYWALKKSNKYEDYFQSPLSQEKIIFNNDSKFKIWLDRYKYNNRFEKYSIEECKLKSDRILSDYEKKLTINEYLINNSIQVTDIAIFPFIRQFANVNIEYFSITYPNINRWLQNLINSNLFKSVMKKYSQWKISDTANIVIF
ncbi:MAG: glutathione S-transferase [Candidatus Marinimicrobia bacterium]|nr:glutathione S-transferase [Candidatus Neomarinimicrobiota bacterium]|tara:strand:- start:377 stop:952 length:576 start_codon:yes stop_codon:yes gene_type:complete